MKVSKLVCISTYKKCKIIIYNGNLEFRNASLSLSNSFNFSMDRISTVNPKKSKTTYLLKNLQSVFRAASMLNWVACCLFATSSGYCIYFSRFLKTEKLKCKWLSEKHWRCTLKSPTIFGNFKSFKNDEKCSLSHLKSSFCSQDI